MTTAGSKPSKNYMDTKHTTSLIGTLNSSVSNQMRFHEEYFYFDAGRKKSYPDL